MAMKATSASAFSRPPPTQRPVAERAANDADQQRQVEQRPAADTAPGARGMRMRVTAGKMIGAWPKTMANTKPSASACKAGSRAGDPGQRAAQTKQPGECQPQVAGEQTDGDVAGQSVTTEIAAGNVVAQQPEGEREQAAGQPAVGPQAPRRRG